VARVTGFDTPFPYTLENQYLPRAPRILRAIRETVAF
jgi:2-oxoisovalerate dehydrogenase E1 component beta subunit